MAFTKTLQVKFAGVPLALANRLPATLAELEEAVGFSTPEEFQKWTLAKVTEGYLAHHWHGAARRVVSAFLVKGGQAGAVAVEPFAREGKGEGDSFVASETEGAHIARWTATVDNAEEVFSALLEPISVPFKGTGTRIREVRISAKALAVVAEAEKTGNLVNLAAKLAERGFIDLDAGVTAEAAFLEKDGTVSDENKEVIAQAVSEAMEEAARQDREAARAAKAAAAAKRAAEGGLF